MSSRVAQRHWITNQPGISTHTSLTLTFMDEDTKAAYDQEEQEHRARPPIGFSRQTWEEEPS